MKLAVVSHLSTGELTLRRGTQEYTYFGVPPRTVKLVITLLAKGKEGPVFKLLKMFSREDMFTPDEVGTDKLQG